MVIIFIGCGGDDGGVDVEELNSKIEKLESKVSSLNQDKASKSKEVSQLKEEKQEVAKELQTLKLEFSDYKKKMEPYESLSTAEAEAKKIEAEKVAEEKKKEKDAAKEEAARLKAEEEARGYETGLTYQDIARSPEEHIGKKVTFTGKVVQLMEGDKENELRVAVDDDYDQMIYVGYERSIVSQRVLEGDFITLYGTSIGTISYDSTMGGKITIPAVFVEKIDFE